MKVKLFGGQNNLSSSGWLTTLHFVPWKPKLVMECGPNGKVTPTEEPMTWIDAAKVAVILSFAEFFVDYCTQHPFPYPGAMVDINAWLIYAVFFLLRKFFTLFVALTGLTWIGSAAIKKSKKEE